MEKKNKEWTNDEMFLLIDIYKNKPCLWDPTQKDYKLKNKRSESWSDIAKIFDCDVAIIRRKIESLMTSFRRERQKYEDSKKSGAGSDDIYIPTWFAFEKMKFLLDKFSPRPTQDTMISIDEDLNESQDNSISRDSDDSMPTSNKIFKSPNNLKRGRNSFDQRAEEAYNIMHEALKRRNEKDQSAIFGEHVANKHRSYSLRTKCMVEHLISNILFEADIGKFDHDPFVSPNYLLEHDYISQQHLATSPQTPSTQTSTYSYNESQLFW